MIDLPSVDPHFYDTITQVVEALVTNTGLHPDNVLVVGAGSRDILHAAFGHTFRARATLDVDLGIAVNDWAVSECIEAVFPRIGSTGIRYRVAGIPVDIMPFGEIEDPDGISHPAARGEDLVVFGFQDVYERALRLPLPNGMIVRLPQPAGYAALKMRSWIDRSVYGHDKDAKDLALAVFWYQESPVTEDRLYGSDPGFTVLADLNMDFDLAATKLLSNDIGDQLSQMNREDLARRWVQQDMRLLTRDFTLPAGGPRTPTIERRLALLEQFSLNTAAGRRP